MTLALFCTELSLVDQSNTRGVFYEARVPYVDAACGGVPYVDAACGGSGFLGF